MTSHLSTRAPEFLATIEGWLRERREVLVMLRWPYGGGARSFEFLERATDVAGLVSNLPPRTSVIVFRDPCLPIRGLVTDGLIRQACEAIPDNTEYLIAGLDPVTHGSVTSFPNAAGESHRELTEHLGDWWPGVRVAVGPHPPWWESGAGVLDAYVPDADGTVTPAAY